MNKDQKENKSRMDLVELEQTDNGIVIKAKNTGDELGIVSNMESVELFLEVLSEEAFY